jgi:hypothetical protein
MGTVETEGNKAMLLSPCDTWLQSNDQVHGQLVSTGMESNIQVR